MKFPSSHYPSTTISSPQIGLHTLSFVRFAIEHSYPANAPVQVGLHPIIFPASQLSVVRLNPNPSPQIV